MEVSFFDYLHAVTASVVNSKRKVNPLNCEVFITHREIWTRAPKAAARKATAEGVNGISLDEKEGRFFIFQISGYNRERGLYCDLLDEAGRVIESY